MSADTEAYTLETAIICFPCSSTYWICNFTLVKDVTYLTLSKNQTISLDYCISVHNISIFLPLNKQTNKKLLDHNCCTDVSLNALTFIEIRTPAVIYFQLFQLVFILCSAHSKSKFVSNHWIPPKLFSKLSLVNLLVSSQTLIFFLSTAAFDKFTHSCYLINFLLHVVCGHHTWFFYLFIAVWPVSRCSSSLIFQHYLPHVNLWCCIFTHSLGTISHLNPKSALSYRAGSSFQYISD